MPLPTTATARRTSTSPRPRSSTSVAGRRSAPPSPAGAAPGCRVGSRRCSWESMSAARSPMPCSRSTASVVTAKAPTTPDDQSEGVIAAVQRRARAGRRERERGRDVLARDDGRHQRAARGPRRAHGADRHRGLHRPHRARPPDARRALPAVRGAPRAARARRAPLRRARADDAGRPAATSSRPKHADAGWRSRSPRPTPRRSRSCCCTPTATPSTSARSARRSPSAPRRPRVAVARGGRHLPRVRARRHHRDRRRALAAARRLPAPARRQRARCGPARARDHAVQRRPDRPRRRPPATPPGPCSRAPPAAPPARRSWRAPSDAPDALCFDMGGTSCDVCVIDDGAVQEQQRGRDRGAAAGAADARDPHRRRGRRLDRLARRRAARCASARNRPAPTRARPATDAAAPSRPSPTPTSCSACCRPTRRWPAASSSTSTRPSGRSARSPTSSGSDSSDCAEGIRRVADAEMVRALRVVTVQRGIDPRRYALLPFGGAGPLHADPDRRGAGDRRRSSARAPRACWPRSGLVVSPRRRDVQRTLLLAGDELTADAVAEAVAELGEQARDALSAPEAELGATYELRYRGPGVRAGDRRHRPTPQPEQLREAFEAEHEDRYGYSDSDQVLELVTIRVTATVPGAEVTLAADGDDARGPAEAAAGDRRRRADRPRGPPRRPAPRAPRSKAPRSSSCRSRRCWSPTAGRARSTTPARSAWSARARD